MKHTLFLTLSLSVFFLYGNLISGLAQADPPRGDGYALRHDAEKYGTFLEPRMIEGSLPTSDLVIHENWLFAVGFDQVTVYDLTDPLHPKETAKLFGIGEGRQVEYYKGHLYVTARTDGLYVIDVSDPARPRQRAHYDTMELATGLHCVDDVAYVSQRQFGTEMIDISDPSDPRHLGFVVSGEAQSVDCLNGILYAGDWGVSELTVIDVRNPKNSQIIGKGKLDGLGDGVYVRDEIAYASTGPRVLRATPSPGHGLDLFSIANPREPKLLGRLKFPTQAVHRFPDFWAVSVNEKKMAYAVDSFNGIFCVDVSDPQNPRSVAYSVLPVLERTGNPDPAAGVAVGDGILYVCGVQGGVYVLEAPGIASPVSEERSAPKLDSPVLPDLPMEEALLKDFFVLPTRGQALAAAIWRDRYAWVAAGTEGLLLVDLQSDEPAVRAVIPTLGFAYDVKIDGDRLFTAEGHDGVAVYQIKPSGQLQILGRYDFPAAVRQITIPIPGLTAKFGNSNLALLDVSNPAAMQVLGRDQIQRGILYGRDFVEGLSPQGFGVLVAQGNALIWYDMKNFKRQMSSFEGKVSFSNGACWHGDQLLFFAGRRCWFPNELEARPLEEVPSCQLPELSGFGKAVSNGSRICFTDRRSGQIFFLTMPEPQKLQIERHYSIHGHPELAFFAGDRVIIPCGHAGLLIEKKH